jgi:hypothetical protein
MTPTDSTQEAPKPPGPLSISELVALLNQMERAKPTIICGSAAIDKVRMAVYMNDLSHRVVIREHPFVQADDVLLLRPDVAQSHLWREAQP